MSIATLSIANQNLKPYRKRAIDFIGRDQIYNKRILEVGGDHTLQVSNYLIEQGASKVVAISIDKRFPNKTISEKLEARRLSVHKISESINKEFALVIGIAILQHIPDLSNMMKELFKVTKPGGSVILNAVSIWTSPLGHQIWINTGKLTIQIFW